MSLHRYFPPPPLALAIHPAPTSRPKVTNKDKHDKAKVNLQAKAEKGKQDQKGQGGKADKCTPTKCDAIVKIKDGAVLTPISPGSNLPEPPTSALGAVVSDNDKEADAKKSQPEQKDNDQIDSTSKLTDQVPEALAEKKDDGSEHIHKETDLEPEPLILLSPAPYRPLRTRLDLHPSVVYPPVNTDPRGAYHKYAKAVGAEVIYVDVTKDGWLTQQWKERNEREALKRLMGEWEKEVQKEIEKERKRVIKKTVPKTSEGILLNLWNELVEANNHELSANEFWNMYDWNDSEARKHLRSDVKRPEIFSQQDNKTDSPARTTAQKPEIEWTKEGVEDILSTVGIQCVYNIERPPSRHWSEPAAAFLLFTHGFFLLRLDIAITWKPEDRIKQGFQVLITNSNDRVFGEMVKAQQAEDRKRKEKEYRERKEKERKERKEKEEKEKQHGKTGIDEAPVMTASDANALDGEPPVITAKPPLGKAITTIPVITPSDDADSKNQNQQGDQQAVKKDVKQEIEAEHAPGPKAADRTANPAGVEKNKKLNEADAKALARAIKPNGAVGLDGINMTMKALELAVDDNNLTTKSNDTKPLAKDKPLVKKDPVPLFWTWTEKCEKWRWRNYDAGVHLVGPGGWEERDWQVFADGRQIEYWDAEQEKIEKEEIDIHDWSL